MIISNCPRCQEGFRVPLGTIPEDAYAVCPWCHETFPLVEVLDHLPPVLQILTADGEPIAVMEPVSSEAASGTQTLAGLSIGASEQSQTNSASGSTQNWDPTTLNFGADSGHADGEWNPAATSQAAPMSVSPRPNRRKKSGSGIRSMIQVVVGGLLSVPIALAILLAAGRAPDLGFWPFDGESRSPRELLPFLDDTDTGEEPVFPSFEGQKLDTSKFDDAMNESEDPSQSALEQIFAPEEPSQPADQSNLNETQPTNPAKAAVFENKEDTIDPSQPKELVNPPQLPNTAANTATGSTTLKKPEPTLSETSDDHAGSSTTARTASQIKNSQQLNDSTTKAKSVVAVPAQTLIEVTAAIRAIEALNDSDQTIDTDTLAEAYERIAEACATAQKYPSALSSLANAISKSTVSQQIQEAAVTWLDYPQRATEGIALIGKPGTTAKGQILTLDSGRVLQLSGDRNLPLAERVLVLGQITDKPDEIEISFTAPLP